MQNDDDLSTFDLYAPPPAPRPPAAPAPRPWAPCRGAQGVGCGRLCQASPMFIDHLCAVCADWLSYD